VETNRANADEFKIKWKEYLFAVLSYAYEGNLETDWIVQEKQRRKWYHAPWMHAGVTGREFMRGLTTERRSCAKELLEGKICDDDKLPIENWAVSVYNEPGAFYINKVWKEMLKSEPNPKNFPAQGFPEGTVAIKLLFTQAEPDYLKTASRGRRIFIAARCPRKQCGCFRLMCRFGTIFRRPAGFSEHLFIMTKRRRCLTLPTFRRTKKAGFGSCRSV
jgi:hypothetical protein